MSLRQPASEGESIYPDSLSSSRSPANRLPTRRGVEFYLEHRFAVKRPQGTELPSTSSRGALLLTPSRHCVKRLGEPSSLRPLCERGAASNPVASTRQEPPGTEFPSCSLREGRCFYPLADFLVKRLRTSCAASVSIRGAGASSCEAPPTSSGTDSARGLFQFRVPKGAASSSRNGPRQVAERFESTNARRRRGGRDLQDPPAGVNLPAFFQARSHGRTSSRTARSERASASAGAGGASLASLARSQVTIASSCRLATLRSSFTSA